MHKLRKPDARLRMCYCQVTWTKPDDAKLSERRLNVMRGETVDLNRTPEAVVILSLVALCVIGLVAAAIIPYWKIYTKTGQSGAMALLQLIPLVNLVMLYVLAFTEWPLEREIREARASQRLAH